MKGDFQIRFRERLGVEFPLSTRPHYCSKRKNGKFRIERKTSGKKFRRRCKQMNTPIRDMRFCKKVDIIAKVNRILSGYYHYYSIPDSNKCMSRFRNREIQLLFL